MERPVTPSLPLLAAPNFAQLRRVSDIYSLTRAISSTHEFSKDLDLLKVMIDLAHSLPQHYFLQLFVVATNLPVANYSPKRDNTVSELQLYLIQTGNNQRRLLAYSGP